MKALEQKIKKNIELSVVRGLYMPGNNVNKSTSAYRYYFKDLLKSPQPMYIFCNHFYNKIIKIFDSNKFKELYDSFFEII